LVPSASYFGLAVRLAIAAVIVLTVPITAMLVIDVLLYSSLQ
jgi:hypothetical protein